MANSKMEYIDRRRLTALTPKQWASCVVSYNTTYKKPTLSINGTGGGVIFYVPWNVSDVYFKKNAIYCQYGLCENSASMPSIINNGTGRLGYKVDTNTNGYIHINMSDSDINLGIVGAYLFIGGSTGLVITDLYAVVKEPD